MARIKAYARKSTGGMSESLNLHTPHFKLTQFHPVVRQKSSQLHEPSVRCKTTSRDTPTGGENSQFYYLFQPLLYIQLTITRTRRIKSPRLKSKSAIASALE